MVAQDLDEKPEGRRTPPRRAQPPAVALVLLAAAGLVMTSCGGGTRVMPGIQFGDLGPLPAYPQETTGWDTSQILMVYPGSGLAPEPALAGAYAAASEHLEAGLRQRGYAVMASPAGAAGMVTATMRNRVARVIVPQGSQGRMVKLTDGRIGREVVFMARVVAPEQIGDPRAGRTFLAAVHGTYPSRDAVTAETEQQLLFAAIDKLFCIPAFRQALQ